MQRALLILLIAASYLLFAGGPSWTALPLLGVALATVVVAPRRTLGFPRTFWAIDFALVAVVAGTLLQAMPLPVRVTSLVSPHLAALQTAIRISALGSTPPVWTSLSIARRDTLYALSTLMLGILTFWSTRAAFPTGGVRQFCRWLALLGAVAAVLSLYHRAVAPGMLLGVLRPEARSASPFGAFVNRNHFAAWLLMMAAPVWGYLVAHLNTHHGYRSRGLLRESLTSGGLLVALAAIMMIGVLFVTVSRSALIGVGVAGACGLLLSRGRLAGGLPLKRLVTAAVGIILVVGLMFVDLNSWAQRIDSSFSDDRIGTNRLVIWQETLPIVKDFPLTGTGAGTFSSAMTVYQHTRLWVGSMQQWAHFNNAHSHYLQIVTEGGLLLALPALLALIAMARLTWRAVSADRGEIFWVRAAAGAGLAGIAAQSIWEVPLVMPANAVLCGVLAGLVLHQRDADARGTARRGRERH